MLGAAFLKPSVKYVAKNGDAVNGLDKIPKINSEAPVDSSIIIDGARRGSALREEIASEVERLSMPRGRGGSTPDPAFARETDEIAQTAGSGRGVGGSFDSTPRAEPRPVDISRNIGEVSK